jgi:hypothetical protein
VKTFKQWINEEKKPAGSPLAAINSKTIKSKRDRDRLTRMETMLHELINLKQLIVDRTTNHVEHES